jgi:predicted ATPase/DNA-binding SARP family transcriptional activator
VQTAADTVRIGVLGPLEVTDTAGRPVRVGGHRVRTLLILLALDAGHVVPAPVLIERLWPQSRPADAANALQSLVSRLRVAFRQGGVPDGVLASSPAGYRLAVPPEAVDALAFAAQARAGNRALARGDAREAARLLAAALGAWRGDALADVAGEEFAFAPAARLAELRDAATLDRIEADLLLGAADSALTGELRQLTAADPLAERPAALLMRALAAAGRQAAALAVYQQTREQLADHLGMNPSALLEQTYLAVLRQEVPQAAAPGGAAVQPGGAAPPPAPAQTDVPAKTDSAGGAENAMHPGSPASVRRPPTSFVGRDDDVSGVLKRLAAERLVTLTGPGGVGKTRLSAEAAARLAVPVWFAELAPVTDPAEVPYAVLDALGLRERSIARRGPDSAGDPVGRLCAALGDRDALLILDNCEHVIDAAAGLAARLLTDCPAVRILATSREPLQIPGEVLHPVAPLAVPGVAEIPEVSTTYPAVRLFADRAAAVLPGFSLDAGNLGAVAGICRNLDGMPLAIELAAPWLRTLTPVQLAGRLDDRFALLTGGSRTALPRHQTLRAVVDWSWDLLSDAERRLARRLAVLPGGATLAATEAIASPENPLPALAGLVGKSIVTRAGGGEPGNVPGQPGQEPEPRYRMLETVRAYCLERLAEAGDDTQARDAAARYYLDFAETADPLLRSAEQARWFRALTAEQDNVNAAVRWAIARGDAATALRFVRSLGYYWVQRGHGEADALSREILALPPPSPLTLSIAEGRVVCALLAAGWSWDIDTIRGPLVEALAAVAQFGDDIGSLHPVAALAEPVLLQYDGGTDQVRRHYERYITAGGPWLRAVSQVYLATFEGSSGQLDEAEEHCRAGLAELRALGERWGVAIALTQLAEFTELRADHASSIEALTEAAAIGREVGAWGDRTYVQARLALIHARAGDLNRASEDLAQVQRTAEARGAQVDTDRWVVFMRAELAWHEGDYAEVVRYCEAVLAAIAANQAPWWQSLRAQVKARMAMAALELGGTVRCRALLSEALDSAAAWRENPALAAVLDACAVYFLRRGAQVNPDQVNPDQVNPAQNDAERAARVLGAAHAVRGAFDESSLEAPRARDWARGALASRAFESRYESARTSSTYESAVTFAREGL